jgi:telomere length regulation protein
MVVGTAVSTLVDNDGSRMNFGSEEMQTEEACGYLQLAKTHDEVEGIESFHQLVQSEPDASKLRKKQVLSAKLPIIDGKPVFGPARPPVQTEVIGEKISEVFDDNDEDVDELKPYAKPDDDPEDSDEDATLVKRNKPRAPVYIRDLMRMLKDDKDHDRFQLAIKTAPTLIRRKSSFGGEVRDHAEELALIFCDLQDPFDTEDFDELRLQSLIAVLLSDVDRIAPWLSRHTFAGEYSLSQRCIMMSTLGLGGREIAGLSEQDATYNPSLLPGSAAFPSKRLPSRLHAVYEPTHSAVRNLENASKNVEHALIKPLALSAADQTTSHLNAVKVRTFSSRMEVERTKRKPAPNRLAKILGEAFFFPLVSRYQQDVAAYGQASVFTSAPIVLVTLVKTLALLLHASGPVTSNLPEITTAFWDLLLNLRVSAISDVSIMEAVLFSLLTLLEINSEDHAKQRLVQENPKHLAETQTWAELVFDRTGGGKLVVEGSGEEARVRTLAASVLVKTRDVIEAYQQQLMGGLHP